MTHASSALTPGLEGVVAARTRLSHVEGDVGRLTIAGYPVGVLAPALDFETAAFVLWHDHLPTNEEREAMQAAIERGGRLPAALAERIGEAARSDAPAIAALRLGVAWLGLHPHPEAELLGAVASLLATFGAARRATAAPSLEGGIATGVLAGLCGEAPSPARVRALQTYLNTVIDHGLNASAFTARVIASTGASLSAAIEGGLAALEGPLHGGAPGPALRALLQLRRQPGSLDENTRRWVRDEVGAGRRIMGFGHRVYRVRDPRADVLRDAAQTLLGDTELAADAAVHERAVLETLAELKPDRPLATNVEFYTALLLHGLGIDDADFTAVFAVARTAGWIGHVREQIEAARLIRPRAEYIGAHDRSLTA